MVCRDRAGAYSEAIRTGAPQAAQVAGRFHLWQNLCDAAGRTAVAHHHCLRAPDPDTTSTPALPPREYLLAVRTRARHAEIHEHLARGLSCNQVARQLNLHIQAVRRFANAASPQALSAKAEYRPTKLDPYIDLVNQRRNEGVDTACRSTRNCEPSAPPAAPTSSNATCARCAPAATGAAGGKAPPHQLSPPPRNHGASAGQCSPTPTT